MDPPSVFFGLWKLVHPLLPEKTARKVRHMVPAGLCTAVSGHPVGASLVVTCSTRGRSRALVKRSQGLVVVWRAIVRTGSGLPVWLILAMCSGRMM